MNSSRNWRLFFLGWIGDVRASEADRETLRDERRDVSLEWLLRLRGGEVDCLRLCPPPSSLDLSWSRLALLLLEREYPRDRLSSPRSCLSSVARRTGREWRVRGTGLLVVRSSDDCRDRDESELLVRRRFGEGSGVSTSLFMLPIVVVTPITCDFHLLVAMGYF